MGSERAQRGEDLPVIDEVLDAMKATRNQFGTIAHMGGDVERSLSGMRALRDRLQLFSADRSRAWKAAAAVIAAAAALSFVRAWLSLARGSALNIRRSFRIGKQFFA